ncbi:conserved exported hypothetical protein [Microbacterium sp. C448]|nr:conserved exported hypothetical protein [Microbacterium sp. C448]
MLTVTINKRRRILWIALASVAFFVIVGAAALWTLSRAQVARDSLESAAEVAATFPELLASGDTAATEAAAEQFATDARAARDATSDIVWRTAEVIPWVRPNLSAVRQVSEIADDLATEAVTPLVSVAEGIDLAQLGFADGRIDVAPLADASPALARANEAFQRSVTTVEQLPDPTVSVVADAVDRLTEVIVPAAVTIDTLDRAAALLPAMLGAEGPRTYLLLMLNNAEARTYGGIPGAGAVLSVNDGRIGIERQLSSGDYLIENEPVITLSPPTFALFGDQPGRYIQNTMSPLDFSEGAEAAATLLERSTGITVDGVIAVDTVGLSYFLETTGPIDVGPFELDSGNAVDILLSDAYRSIQEPSVLDAFFAMVAVQMFQTVTSGEVGVDGMIGAAERALDEHRLHVWSRHPDEQARIDGSALETMLLPDDASATRVGVFYNDLTGAKLDYYAEPSVTVELDDCSAEPTVSVTVDWTNTIPPDAATSLPSYVNGFGLTDTPIGETMTRLTVVGPQGWTLQDYTLDDAQPGVQTAQFDERSALQTEFVTSAGGAHRFVVEYSGASGSDARADWDIVTTPLASETAAEFLSANCTG